MHFATKNVYRAECVTEREPNNSVPSERGVPMRAHFFEKLSQHKKIFFFVKFCFISFDSESSETYSGIFLDSASGSPPTPHPQIEHIIFLFQSTFQTIWIRMRPFFYTKNTTEKFSKKFSKKFWPQKFFLFFFFGFSMKNRK